MTIIPFDDREGVIWMNGAMIPWRETKLHVLSHGLHYASCVFEGERVYNRTPFKLTEHSQRLADSASILGFDLPYTVAEIDAATRAVVDANRIVDGYVRPVAWRGSEMMGVSAQRTQINVAIAVWQWPSYFDAAAKMQGIRLTLSRWRRPAPDTAPVFSKAAGRYMVCTMGKHEAEGRGFHDALMLDWRGLVAEATGANIFFAIDGKLHTPTPDCFLDGITRRTIMDLARARGIEVVERAIRLEDMSQAQEVFLTGTAAEVTPVGQIDDLRFQPGPICELMVGDYARTVQSYAVAAAA